MQPAMTTAGSGGNPQTSDRDAGVIDVSEGQPFQIDHCVDPGPQRFVGYFHAAQIAQTFFPTGCYKPDVAFRGDLLLSQKCQQPQHTSQTKTVIAQARTIDDIAL